MSYSENTIRENIQDLTEEYIMFVVSASQMGIKKLRGAYRNEFQCDSSVMHHIAENTRKEICEGVIRHMTIADNRVYLNSIRTHWYELEQIISYWKHSYPSEQMVKEYYGN